MRALRLAPLLALLAFASCRTVSVSSDPSPTYSIDVVNETGVAMIVRYNDGRGDAVLGTVPAARSERFIIAAPAAPTIAVRGTTENGSRTAGPYTVNLIAGTTQTVRLR